MRGNVENARTVELFERGLGGLPSGKHCGLGQNRFERPRFARRTYQRREIDLIQVEVRADGVRKPMWKADVSSLCRDCVPRDAVIGIGHNYCFLIVWPAYRRSEQVAPAHKITDRVTFDQVAVLPVNEGGERYEVEYAIGRYQQATGGFLPRLS